MAEYLVLAESIIFKNDKLTCINAFDNFKTVAMPSEFNFDMAILCGPNWSVGEHKLNVKLKASNGKETELGNITINVPNEDFVYHAFLNNIKVTMDYSVNNVTFYVYDNKKEIMTRNFPVIPLLVPQKEEQKKEKKKKETSK